MLKKVLIVIVIVAVLAAAYFVWTFFNVPVATYLEMEQEEAVETLLVSGRVIAVGAVPLSFERPGRVLELNIEEGDVVATNDVIARQDSSQALNRVRQSENQLDSTRLALERLQNRELEQARESLIQAEKRAETAESAYDIVFEDQLEPALERVEEAEEEEQDARRNYEEKEDLFALEEIEQEELNEVFDQWDQAIAELDLAREELEQAERETDSLARERDISLSQKRSAASVLSALENEELRQVRLNVEQAENQLDQSRLELEQTELRAPFGGVITSITANKGQYVAIGQEICMIIPASSSTVIEAMVDEEFAGVIAVGQEVLVSSSAFPDQLFKGKVGRLASSVNPDRGTFPVRFKLDRFESELLPDLAVSAEIVTGRIADSLVLEQVYTFREDDQVYVFMEKNGIAEKRAIETKELGRGLLLVQEGLQPGDKVLTELDLSDGQRIRLRETGSSN
ncbi:MAG: efflux RND transporter periplasmic adaptor subunit [Bacillota bacterium]